jgi:hypothetical protein
MRKRALRCMLAAAAICLAGSACQQQKAATPAPAPNSASAPEPAPVHYDVATPSAPTDLSVVQKTFTLKTSVVFPFEIPAHAVRPHLHGLYTSFVGDVHGESGSAANIDFLILNDDQYEDFQKGGASETLFAVEASHNQAVNFDLPASMDHAVKYYLVFRSSRGDAKKTVEANFKVDF